MKTPDIDTTSYFISKWISSDRYSPSYIEESVEQLFDRLFTSIFALYNSEFIAKPTVMNDHQVDSIRSISYAFFDKLYIQTDWRTDNTFITDSRINHTQVGRIYDYAIYSIQKAEPDPEKYKSQIKKDDLGTLRRPGLLSIDISSHILPLIFKKIGNKNPDKIVELAVDAYVRNSAKMSIVSDSAQLFISWVLYDIVAIYACFTKTLPSEKSFKRFELEEEYFSLYLFRVYISFLSLYKDTEDEYVTNLFSKVDPFQIIFDIENEKIPYIRQFILRSNLEDILFDFYSSFILTQEFLNTKEKNPFHSDIEKYWVTRGVELLKDLETYPKNSPAVSAIVFFDRLIFNFISKVGLKENGENVFKKNKNKYKKEYPDEYKIIVNELNNNNFLFKDIMETYAFNGIEGADYLIQEMCIDIVDEFLPWVLEPLKQSTNEKSIRDYKIRILSLFIENSEYAN